MSGASRGGGAAGAAALVAAALGLVGGVAPDLLPEGWVREHRVLVVATLAVLAVLLFALAVRAHRASAQPGGPVESVQVTGSPGAQVLDGVSGSTVTGSVVVSPSGPESPAVGQVSASGGTAIGLQQVHHHHPPAPSPAARSSPGTAVASVEPGQPGDAVGERAVQARDITGSTLITGDHVTVLRGAATTFGTSTAAEWAEATRHAGAARRRLSRERLGLTAAQVAASFVVEDALPDGLRDLDAGEVRILVGPLGAGKSDLAERWLRTSADAYTESLGSTAVPVWASATTIDRPLQEYVSHLLGRPEVLSSNGVDLVVDGLDEQPGAAASLLEQARVLVAIWPRSRVVMAARAGVAVPDSMAVPVIEWERDGALRLIASVTGTDRHQHIDHYWPEALRRSIRRPFFALLAAAHMSDQSIPQTGADLIDRAVRQALGDSAPTGALRSLAAERVRTGRAVDLHARFPDRAAALVGSRLLVVDQGRAVFALPIFEQWFAAQALLRAETDLRDALAHMAAFDRWRYALAVAVASGQTPDVDRLMSAVARWNVGAASWLVNEAISTRLSPAAEQQPLDDWMTVGTSIRAATGAWLTGLGPASQLVDPVRRLPSDDADPLGAATLAVAVENGRISQGWTAAARVPGPVAYGPPSVFDPVGYSYDWCGLCSGVPAPSPNWVWRWTLEDLRSDLERTLVFDVDREAAAGGVIEREWVYSRARALLDSHLRPRTWETVLERLSEMRQRAAGADHISFRIGLVTFDPQDIERMHRLVDPSASGPVVEPWPARDAELGGWVWSGYSPERLLERTAAIYGGALAAYREISEGMLASFGDTLGHAALLPAVLEGRLIAPRGDGFEHGPQLNYMLRPVGTPGPGGRRLGDDAVDMVLVEGSRDSSPPWDEDWWQAAATERNRYEQRNPGVTAFSALSQVRTVLDVWGTRPATSIALEWIWKDLQELGWVTRMRPPELR